MKKGIWQEFDGYNEIVKEIEAGRNFGTDYYPPTDSADQYIDRLHPARLNLRLADVIEVTPTSKTLRFVSTDQYLPPFQAGQYVALFLQIGAIRTSRPYSISSPPNQIGYYDLTVRRVPGGLVSNYLLDEMKRGDLVQSSGPAGHFYYNPLYHDRTSVCLAGGSGITPFMSMIAEATDCGLDREIHLFYGNRSLDDAIFHEMLSDLAGRFDNIHYYPVIEDPPSDYQGPTGLMTGDLFKGTLGNLDDKTYYLCGPQAMYDFCLPELGKLGIPDRKVRKEVYGTPVNIADQPGWPKEVDIDAAFKVKISGGPGFEARAGETLLTALEKQGLLVPSECRSGECSMCRVKVLSGRVFQPTGALVRKSDRKFGYVHSCVSYPLTDLEIII